MSYNQGGFQKFDDESRGGYHGNDNGMARPYDNFNQQGQHYAPQGGPPERGPGGPHGGPPMGYKNDFSGHHNNGHNNSPHHHGKPIMGADCVDCCCLAACCACLGELTAVLKIAPGFKYFWLISMY